MPEGPRKGKNLKYSHVIQYFFTLIYGNFFHRIAPVDEWIRLTKTSFNIDPESRTPGVSHIKWKCNPKMLQFKIISNKITYLTSVYLIKVKGGGRLCKTFCELYVYDLYCICTVETCHNTLLPTNALHMHDICRKTKSHLWKNMEWF